MGYCCVSFVAGAAGDYLGVVSGCGFVGEGVEAN
jgi:hypothetical protein